MTNEVWDFHVIWHSLFPFHRSTKQQIGAGEAVPQPKKLVFLFLCLVWIDFMRRWENWEQFSWHLKYFLSRIGTQTLSLIEAITTSSSQVSPILELGQRRGQREGYYYFFVKIWIELAHWFRCYYIWIDTDTGIHTLIAQCSFLSGTLTENVKGGRENK